MNIASQNACRKLHHCVTKIDDGGARDGFDVDPFSGIRESNLEAAEPVHEDGQTPLGIVSRSRPGRHLIQTYIQSRCVRHSLPAPR